MVVLYTSEAVRDHFDKRSVTDYGRPVPFCGIILGLDNGLVLSQDNKIQKLSRNMSQALALVLPNGI